ncbi:MAG: FxsA family protein [Verrucomicrobiota bacterium]
MFARLLLLFITVPLIELLLLIKIAPRIGIYTTLILIILTGFIGAALTRYQGLRTLAKFQQATNEGRMPHQEVLDGLMILVAGAVLLTPGFLTDAFGFALLVPAVRTGVRKYLAKYVKNHVQVVTADINTANPASPQQSHFPPDHPREEKVVDAKVIDTSSADK